MDDSGGEAVYRMQKAILSEYSPTGGSLVRHPKTSINCQQLFNRCIIISTGGGLKNINTDHAHSNDADRPRYIILLGLDTIMRDTGLPPINFVLLV